MKLVLTGVATPWYYAGMPNQRDPKKKLLRLWIPDWLYEKLRARAERLDSNMSSLVTLKIIEMVDKPIEEEYNKHQQ